MSRTSVIYTKVHNEALGRKFFTFALNITNSMQPSVNVIAYTEHDGDIVFDYQTIGTNFDYKNYVRT